MDTFLAICQAVRQEAGLSGNGPAAVETAVGIEKKIVGWVRQAWLDIQQYRHDWPWMISSFTFNLSPGKERYSPAELSLSSLVESWLFEDSTIYATDTGKADESYIYPRNYYREWPSLNLGVQTNSRPTFVLYDPTSNAIVFWPTPEKEYTFTSRYFRQAQRLAAGADVPLFPTSQKFQEIIKWGALKYYGFHDGAPDTLAEAENEYTRMLMALDNQYGPIITITGRPIA